MFGEQEGLSIRGHMKGDVLQASKERRWIESHWSADGAK